VKTILASRFKNLLLLAVVAPFCFGGLNAKANLLTTFGPEMGDLLRWAALSGAGGLSAVDTIDAFSGTTDIYGDVGIAGDGNITMSGGATIHGDLYYYSTGTLKKNGNAMVTGATYHDAAHNTDLNRGVQEAMDTAAAAFALPATRPQMSINLGDHQNLTLTGAPGETVVLQLSNFSLSASATLTLQGSATTNFVLNVSNQFSLTGGSKIVLSGGVAWDCVLFNVVNTGSDVKVSGQSILNGVLMANKRTVELSAGALVNGEVVANQIKMSGSSEIIHPALSSP
jgi:cytoskeletal protein CcmA (bactofilin family)